MVTGLVKKFILTATATAALLGSACRDSADNPARKATGNKDYDRAAEAAKNPYDYARNPGKYLHPEREKDVKQERGLGWYLLQQDELNDLQYSSSIIDEKGRKWENPIYKSSKGTKSLCCAYIYPTQEKEKFLKLEIRTCKDEKTAEREMTSGWRSNSYYNYTFFQDNITIRFHWYPGGELPPAIKTSIQKYHQRVKATPVGRRLDFLN